MSDGSVVGLVGSTRAGWAVAAIDQAGRIRDLTSRANGDAPIPQLWKTFSGNGLLVVATMSFGEAVDRGRPLSVSLVSVRDGHAVKAAVHLPATSEAVP